MSDKWREFILMIAAFIFTLILEAAWLCFLIYLINMIPVIGFGCAIFLGFISCCGIMYILLIFRRIYRMWYDEYHC